MKHLVALGLALAVAACSGGQKTDTGKGSGAGDGSGSGTGAGSSVTAKPLTEDECTQLAGHIVDLQLAERLKQKPDEPQATPERVAEIKAKNAKEGMAECLTFDRPSFDCVMAAADLTALMACGQ